MSDKQRSVDVDKLQHAFDSRVSINDDWVITIAEAYESGQQVPPIIINRQMEIIDGRHRVQAAALAGLTRIEATIVDLEGKEALLQSVRLNTGGPMPPTMKDFQLVIGKLMDYGDSEAKIAMELKLPRTMIRKVYANLARQRTHEKLREARRLIAEGLTVEEAAEKLSLELKSLKLSLTMTGSGTGAKHSLYNKLSSSITNHRTYILSFLRRVQERINEEEDLITAEEIDAIWSRVRDMVEAAKVRVADLSSRSRQRRPSQDR